MLLHSLLESGYEAGNGRERLKCQNRLCSRGFSTVEQEVVCHSPCSTVTKVGDQDKKVSRAKRRCILSMVKKGPASSAQYRQTPSAEQAISAGDQERFLSILRFWHKIEFFIPFDLDQRIVEADEHNIRYLHEQDLDRASSALWRAQVKEDEEVKRFNLYIGVFDKAEITKVSNRVLGRSQEGNEDEEFERTELERPHMFCTINHRFYRRAHTRIDS